jgi:two-component system, OmpR family, KDP operon response regulator KdpE
MKPSITMGAGCARTRVLVCDSDSQSLRGLQVVLRRDGLEVDVTTTGKEALDRAALCVPEAAIIELRLPDGVAVCRRLRELVARLHAIMRRAGRVNDQPAFQLDGLEINLASRFVRRQGVEVRLTPIEFKLLRVLVSHPGRLLTHTALLREVWGAAYEEDRQTLRAHIANLRRKLEPATGPPSFAPTMGSGITSPTGGSPTPQPGCSQKWPARNRRG